jgi:anti-sigma regulatory factor (Ser/Thr protein kinase)
MFGRDGVEATVRSIPHRSMAAMLETVLEAVRRHSGAVPQADDITIVLIARHPEPTVASYVERGFSRSNAELDAIFAFIDAFFAGRALDADLRQPVSFIVEELFTNMVKYNTGTRSDITLSLDHAPAQLTVRLVDSDVEPFDVASAPLVDVDKPLDARSIGGLGLHLVRSMADTLLYEYVERRSIVTFTKSLV